MINELTCAYFYLCGIDRCDPLVLVLYGDVIIFKGFPLKLVIWCPLSLPHDVELRDDGVWQVSYDVRLCSIIFIGG